MDTTKKNVRKKTKGKSFLPDEIIRNILLRLPVKSVMRCRLVCKGWKDFTSARDFVDLHLKNSIPIIFVANPRVLYSGLDLFGLDKLWELSASRLAIHKFPFFSGKYSRALLSHDGIIVLKEYLYTSYEAKFIILNPARPSHECVTITFPKELPRSQIYGVYFHPILKEYCSLWEIYESGPVYDQPKRIQYKILNLGSNPSFKAINNPFSNKIKMLGVDPLYIDNCLYWMLESEHGYKYSGRNDIMKFDIISEEFKVIPCPVPVDTECTYSQTYLLNINGILSFLLFVPSKIVIWRLEDHVECLWTADEYNSSLEMSYSWKVARGIAVVDEKLAALFEKRLLVCNLTDGTTKSFQKKKYCAGVAFLSHQMSLASLSNCKHTLVIYQEDNVCKVVAV